MCLLLSIEFHSHKLPNHALLMIFTVDVKGFVIQNLRVSVSIRKS